MSKMALKADLLKMLRDEMMEEERDEGMSGLRDILPQKKMQATIMADDEKGLLEGAKKLPEVLSKAEKFRKARMGDKKKK